MTAEEYLEWQAKQELRHEYIDGEILAMTGGSLPHIDLLYEGVSFEQELEVD
ncbi:hypothetical protein [Microcoleus sp. LEGE 07076]|uniref:hypothetical protein n=1 Tax=Microcoleus sp. LEGE 07076 TaxID=915322 RepID=UPI0030D749C3